MNVVWSPIADESVREIREYIETYSESAALEFVRRVTSRAENAGLFPWAYRQVPEVNVPYIREVIAEPYRIWFEIHENADEIEIMVVFHGARHVT